ncbi:MAG: hypothetical protein AAFN77_13150 [Planctomycetota bacterium]
MSTQTDRSNVSTKSSRPLNGIAHYLFALTVVVSCYFGYLKLLVPTIEGPQIAAASPPVIPTVDMITPPIDKNRLIPLLPEGAWELDECKTVMTPTGTILFKTFEPQENGTLKVSPFTLISGLGEDGLVTTANQQPQDGNPKKPIVLRCLAGANLKFDRPIKRSLESGAKLELARLTGEVDIYRPPSQPDRSDMLHVLTRNVQVDQQRIYTLERVAFSLGRHRGRGRNLIIDLQHNFDVLPGERDFSSIDGITRLELAFLEQLRIHPDEKDSGAVSLTANASTQSTNTPVFNKNSPLEIACTGPFVFDLQRDVVTLSENVVATQIDEHRNSIQCDQLSLYLKEKPSAAPLEPATRSEQSKLGLNMGKLELQRFVAKGSPAVVIANSHPAKFTADELSYDAVSNEITGRCRQERNVTVITPDHQVVTKHIAYTMKQKGMPGDFVSQGPGRLLQLGDEQSDELFVTWQRGLESSTDPANPRTRSITIRGAASVKSNDEFEIAAESIEFEVDQQKNRKGKWIYSPLSITASDQVVFHTSKLDGSTDQLTATWVWPTAEAGNRTAGQRFRAGKPVLKFQETDGQPFGSNRFVTDRNRFVEVAPQNQLGDRQPSQQPNRGVRLANFQEPQKPDQVPTLPQPAKTKKRTRLKFHGREVRLTLQQVQTMKLGKPTETTRLVDLVVSRDVEVEQREIDAEPTDEPLFKMSGDKLRVKPQLQPGQATDETETPFRAVISSQIELAQVVTKDFQIAGSQINLDQIENKIWVSGRGNCKFSNIQPTPENPTSSSPFTADVETPTASIANRGKADTDMKISWTGGMIFDGQSIYFENDVLLESTQIKDGERTELRGNSEALKAKLDRVVKLDQLENDQELTGVQAVELVFVDWIEDKERAFPGTEPQQDNPLQTERTGLEIATTTFDVNNRQTMQQSIWSRQATVDVVNERVVAEGPGTIATHQLGKPKTANSPTVNQNPLARFSKRKSGHPISFIQINFDGKMIVDGKRNTVDVFDRIRSAYVDVQSWDQGINPDEALKRSAEGVVLLTCEKLQVAQWQPRDSAEPIHELIASGNVRIDGEELESTAERVSYSQGNDTLVIEGTPRSDAHIWFRKANSSQVQHLVAQKLSYRIADQSYETTVKSISSRK